jgi:hypothetical protein
MTILLRRASRNTYAGAYLVRGKYPVAVIERKEGFSVAKIIIEYDKDQDAADDIDDVRQAVARRNPLDSPNVTLQKGDCYGAVKTPSAYVFEDGEFSVFDVSGRGTIFVVDREWFFSDGYSVMMIDDVIIVTGGEHRGFWSVRGIETGGGNKSIEIVVRNLPIAPFSAPFKAMDEGIK